LAQPKTEAYLIQLRFKRVATGHSVESMNKEPLSKRTNWIYRDASLPSKLHVDISLPSKGHAKIFLNKGSVNR
jgi:hypothetical protein